MRNAPIRPRCTWILSALGVATGLLTLASVTPASANAATEATYKRDRSVCIADAPYVGIGGSVFMQELNQSGVTQMRVHWLLYADYYSPGIHVAQRNKTYYSNTFPNDNADYYWNGATGAQGVGGNYQQWNNLAPVDGGYTRVAKMTWMRPNRLDWKKKIEVTFCS